MLRVITFRLCLLTNFWSVIEAQISEQIFVPNALIGDCFVGEVIDISHVTCAMHAWQKRYIAFTYVPEDRTCYVCLPPYEAGDLSRSQLPQGHTAVMRGK